jgi:hypothetical protein
VPVYTFLSQGSEHFYEFQRNFCVYERQEFRSAHHLRIFRPLGRKRMNEALGVMV